MSAQRRTSWADQSGSSTAAVAGTDEAGADSGTETIAGDSCRSSEAELDDAQLAHRYRPPTEPHRDHNPAYQNAYPNYGNMGFFLGNWGDRGTLLGTQAQQARRKVHDEQVLKHPAHIIILCEANKTVEDLLRDPSKSRRQEDQDEQEAEEDNDEQNASAAVAAEAYDSGPMRKREGQALNTRDRAPHFVQRGKEDGATALLIGAKKSFADGLDCLSYIVYKGGQYKQQKTQKVAKNELSFAELN